MIKLIFGVLFLGIGIRFFKVACLLFKGAMKGVIGVLKSIIKMFAWAFGSIGKLGMDLMDSFKRLINI